MRNCPSDAITVDRNARTWKINRFACVQCKECVTNCPKKCLTMDTEYTAPATEKEEEVLQGPPPPPKPQVVLTEAQKAAIAAAQAKKAAAQKAAAEAGQAKA
jgi:ech hydrogenase subunit F